MVDSKEISHTLFFNIRKYSPPKIISIILPRVNYYGIKQKTLWSICFIIYLHHQKIKVGKCKQGTVYYFSDYNTILFQNNNNNNNNNNDNNSNNNNNNNNNNVILIFHTV